MKPCATHAKYTVHGINDHVCISGEAIKPMLGPLAIKGVNLHVVPLSFLSSDVPHDHAVFTYEFRVLSLGHSVNQVVINDASHEIFVLVLDWRYATYDPNDSSIELSPLDVHEPCECSSCQRTDHEDHPAVRIAHRATILRLRAADDTFSRVVDCRRFELRSELSDYRQNLLLRNAKMCFIDGLHVIDTRENETDRLKAINFDEQSGCAYLSEAAAHDIVFPAEVEDNVCGHRINKHWLTRPAVIDHLKDVNFEDGSIITNDGRRVLLLNWPHDSEFECELMIHDFPSGHRHSLQLQLDKGDFFYYFRLWISPSGKTAVIKGDASVYVVWQHNLFTIY